MCRCASTDALAKKNHEGGIKDAKVQLPLRIANSPGLPAAGRCRRATGFFGYLDARRRTFDALANTTPADTAAAARMAAFDPDRQEPVGFCMPLGTPRNTMAIASPLQVLQQADRVYFVFQPNLLNAEHAGVSRWPTIAICPRPDSHLAGQFAWPLGGDAWWWKPRTWSRRRSSTQKVCRTANTSSVRESWRRAHDPARGRLLIDDLVLDDDATFTTPVKMRRVFAWTPDAQFADGSCSERLWIDALWRHRLAEHAAAARSRANLPESPAQPPSTVEPSR